MFRNRISSLCSFYNRVNQVRRCSTNNVKCQEIRIPVPWGHIAGKWWGPTNRRPVLCFHGWQDNCGTFDRLIPLLNREIGYLALDFPGHGYSSHLPSGMFYHPTVYILLFNHLISYFKWDKICLMGHSLGGVTSFAYSMFLPQNIDFLICLDGSKPMIPRMNANFSISKEIMKFMKFELYQRSEKEPPSYTFEEIKQRISKPHNNSVDIKYASHIALRNIRPSREFPNKYYFARDPRLKVQPLLTWQQSQIVKEVVNMTFPMLIVKALSGSYYEPKEQFYEVVDVIEKINKDFQLCKLEGTHHLHLNNPEVLSGVINKFFEKYYKEDKSKGGIREEIIYEETNEDVPKLTELAK